MIKKICIIGFSFVLIVVLCLGAKSCASKSGDKTKTGSSNYNTFVINAPTNLIATIISQTQINLTWLDNSNNEDGFSLERSSGGSTAYSVIATLASGITSYSEQNLIPTVIYYYRVRAFNSIGDYSGYSNEASVTTLNLLSSSIVEITAGDSHNIARTNNGEIFGWGDNNYSQLGLGVYAPSTITGITRLGNDTDWSRIGVGYYSSYGIKTNQTLWAWGSNESGQLGFGDTYSRWEPEPVGSESDWDSVTGGANHALVIKTNNTLWSCGYNSFGQLGLGYSGDPADPDNPLNYVTTPTQIGTGSDWVIVNAGSAHSIGRKSDGTLWSWGWNGFGQLGINSPLNINRTTPAKIGSDSDWTGVACGYDSTCALKTGGTIWGWGYFKNNIVVIPSQVGSDSDWVSISSGQRHTLIRKNNNTIWSWLRLNSGGNYGQSGRDSFSVLYMEKVIGIDSDWSDIVGGGYHSIGRKTDGSIWVWGRNDLYQLGVGDTFNRFIPCQWGSPSPPTPLVAELVSESRIDLSWVDNSNNETGFILERKSSYTGTYQELATLTTDINYYSDISFSGISTCYYRVKSYNAFGESSYSNEVLVGLSGNWSQAIAAGSYHVVACKNNGTAWSWGDNSYGQLGLGDYTQRKTPTQINTETDWSLVSVGSNQVIMIKTNNTLWSFGRNEYGELGLGNAGTTTKRYTPTQIGADSDWISCESGYHHNIALKSNKTVWTWGRNNYGGQLGDGTYTNRTTPRDIGTDSDWAKIGSGTYHTFAIKTNNTLWSWGNNTDGALGLGPVGSNRTSPCFVGSDSDWSQVTGGYMYTLALKTSGILWVWGRNYEGQLGLGDTGVNRLTPVQLGTNTNWVAISSGYEHNIACDANNVIWGWGRNIRGELGLNDIDYRFTPTQIGDNIGWIKSTLCDNDSIFLKNDGTLWSCGFNNFGQLGLGDNTQRLTPTLIGE